MMENPRLVKNEREAKEFLFDEDGISISLVGVEEGSGCIVIKFLIANDSGS